MGLDQYVFRIRRIREDEAKDLNGLKSDEIWTKGFMTLPWDPKKTGANALDPENRDLYGFGSHITALTSKIAMDRLMADRGFDPQKHEVWGSAIGPSGYHYSIKNIETGESGNIDADRDEIRDRYVDIVPEEVYAVRGGDEVAYWRKKYDLSDAVVHSCSRTVENTGFYRLTDKMLSAIKRHDPDQWWTIRKAKDDLGPDERLFYWEWY